MTSPTFYLSPEHWSPRYDASFFTVHVSNRKMFGLNEAGNYLSQSSLEEPALIDLVKSRYHPACYYEVKVLFGRSEKILWRRFAQFQWLYDQVSIFPVFDDEGYQFQSDIPEFPRKTWFWEWPHKQELERERQEKLQTFLRALLDRPGYAAHFAVIAFLEFESPTFTNYDSLSEDKHKANMMGTPTIEPNAMRQRPIAIHSAKSGSSGFSRSPALQSSSFRRQAENNANEIKTFSDENFRFDKSGVSNRISLPNLHGVEDGTLNRIEMGLSASEHNTKYV